MRDTAHGTRPYLDVWQFYSARIAPEPVRRRCDITRLRRFSRPVVQYTGGLLRSAPRSADVRRIQAINSATASHFDDYYSRTTYWC